MISRIVILVAAIVPALLILAYAIAKGRSSWRSEAMWSAFLVGAVSSFAAIVCEALLIYLVSPASMNTTAGVAASTALIAAIPEEAIKFLVLVGFCERHVDARRLQDVLVLAVAVSLGFATAENFFYVASVTDWQTTASLRATTAVPVHGVIGLVMGALLAAARLSDDRKLWRIAGALAVPIAMHAAYDFSLFGLVKAVDKTGYIVGWLATIAASSIIALVLCNRVLPRAVAADRWSGRDDGSIDTTNWFLAGGVASFALGLLLAVATSYVTRSGLGLATVILPFALSVDAIRTALRRR